MSRGVAVAIVLVCGLAAGCERQLPDVQSISSTMAADSVWRKPMKLRPVPELADLPVAPVADSESVGWVRLPYAREPRTLPDGSIPIHGW